VGTGFPVRTRAKKTASRLLRKGDATFFAGPAQPALGPRRCRAYKHFMSEVYADPEAMSAAQIESGEIFAPRFDAAGLITVVAVDHETMAVLMLAHMNETALRLTLEHGEVHYFSRSRGKLWKKGETSGERQKLVEIRVDCDQDALLLLVRRIGRGAACHTGRASCFYRKISGENGEMRLEFIGDDPLFDPREVYGDQ